MTVCGKDTLGTQHGSPVSDPLRVCDSVQTGRAEKIAFSLHSLASWVALTCIGFYFQKKRSCGADGAMDKHQHINRHGKQTRAYLRTRVRVDIFKVDSWESPETNA